MESPRTHVTEPEPITTATDGRRRIDSVDLLRGIVMVLMALDHVRFFLSNAPFQPEDMRHTNGALFFTRWVTHFCAPVFFLLAGTGASLSVVQGKSVASISRFLWTRGLWLVFLELTVMGFGWSFVPGSSFGGVIWALGWSMILLAGLVRLPIRFVGGFGVALVLPHNLTDRLTPAMFGPLHWLWAILHVKGVIKFESLNFGWYILFPLIPLVGVTACGYALGHLFAEPVEKRRKLLVQIGLWMTVAFLILRATNLYGDPATASTAGGQGRFAVQDTFVMTVAAFLNVEKYPSSLQFLLMTLGPSLMLLGWFEGFPANRTPLGWLGRLFLIFGRVPMFYYVLHLYLIHLAAIGIGWTLGQPVAWLWGAGRRSGGFNLPFIYLVWAAVVAALALPCRWFCEVKRRRKDWWLGYL